MRAPASIAFLDWLEADSDGAAAIKWGVVAADGPFWRALAEVLAESGGAASCRTASSAR
jgi:hypothetical protein